MHWACCFFLSIRGSLLFGQCHIVLARDVWEHSQYSHSLPFPLVNSHFHVLIFSFPFPFKFCYFVPFPPNYSRVPWEFHGNGKHSSEWEREWEWWIGNGREMGIVVWKKFLLVALIIFWHYIVGWLAEQFAISS